MGRLEELEIIRKECRTLVRKRAVVSAGVAVLPVPLLDVVVDAGILTVLIPEISQRFGLAVEQIEAMEETRQGLTWEAIRTRGAQFVGLVMTRALVRKTVQGFAGRLVSRQVAKFVPFGGQIVAAGLGYLVMRQIAYRHIDDCFEVAKAIG